MPAPISRDPMTSLRCETVNATDDGTHQLLDTEGTPFLPIVIVALVRRAVNVTSPPTIAIGIQGPDYADLIPSETLAVTTEGAFERLPTGQVINANGYSVAQTIPAGASVYCRVITPAVADAYDVEFIFIGPYV